MSEEKRELEPVFNNCPYLYEVFFNHSDDAVYAFAENDVQAVEIASKEVDGFQAVELNIVCFANSIINLNKVFK